MAKSNLREFTAKGCFWLVNVTHDAAVPGGVYGPFHSRKEVRAARAMVPAHEQSNRACDAGLRPQPATDRDINPLTR